MIDHTSVAVKDFELSLKFYDETFKILGYARAMTFEFPIPGTAKMLRLASWGQNGKASFWISSMGRKQGEEVGRASGLHFAFQAPNAESVDAWHKKCLELGGQDNGGPGLRVHYHPGYYAAFIADPNGWRIEAVIHDYKQSN